MENRVILTHPEMGVYVGSFLGLGFWSKWDDADQPVAVTFKDTDDAVNYIKSWDSVPEGIDIIQVETTETFVKKELLLEYW